MVVDIQSNVREFREKVANQLVRLCPAKELNDAEVEASLDLLNYIVEEVEELREAIDKLDIVEMADAATDIIYLAVQVFTIIGVDFYACWREVQRSNMTKDRGDETNGFKARKGAKFSRADLAGVIERLRAKAATSPLAVPHDLMADEPADFGAINAASAAAVAQLGEAWAKQDDAKADLLAACKAALPKLSEGDDYARNLILAAIAKAEGGER